MEHVPQKGVEQHPPREKWLGVQPYLGATVMLLVIASFYLYAILDNTELGGLLFFGFLIGLIMHRSRFCFVRAFRCPFMTGDAEMVKVVAMSLVIYGMGVAVIKWAWIQEPSMGVTHNFWIGQPARWRDLRCRHADRRRLRQQHPVAGRRGADEDGRHADRVRPHQLPACHGVSTASTSATRWARGCSFRTPSPGM